MPAPYDARKIANLLLDRFDSVAHALSNKKINKVLYHVHAVALVRLNRPLIRNHFEAWDHGPVVEVLYQAFSHHSWHPIQSRASAFSYATSKDEVLTYDDVLPEDVQFILRVAAYYLRFSADELEEMTHAPDTPWSAVRATPDRERGIRNRIPDDLTRRYFEARLGKAAVN